MTALNDAIVDGALRDLVCELQIPFTMAARQTSGAYRTLALQAGAELILSGVRASKSNTILFEMKPVDPSGPYDQFELDERKFFTAFPELNEIVVRALGFDAVNTDDEPVNFEAVRDVFLQRERETAAKSAAEKARLKEERRQKAEQAEREREASHYLSNPLWGTWG